MDSPIATAIYTDVDIAMVMAQHDNGTCNGYPLSTATDNPIAMSMPQAPAFTCILVGYAIYTDYFDLLAQ